MSRLKTSSALQFRKWQLIGMSWWYGGTLCDHPLPAIVKKWTRGAAHRHTPSVLWCCWLGLLTGKTHYRVGEPTAAWQFVDIRQHRSFDKGRQYVSCGQRQPPSSGAPVNKTAVNYHEGETDPSGFRVWLISSSLRDIFVPPYRQCQTGSSWQQQQQRHTTAPISHTRNSPHSQ